MNTYEVRTGRITTPCETLEEAHAEAKALISPSQPTIARIVEVDENGELVRTVTSYGPANAEVSTED